MKEKYSSAHACAGKSCFNRHHRVSVLYLLCGVSALSISASALPDVPFLQDSGPDGIVSMEAEGYDEVVPGTEHDWIDHAVTGHSGSGALIAHPDLDVRYHNNSVEHSPRLDYRVMFTRAGQHFVWIRSRADGKNDDTVNAGINGVLSATGIVLPKKDWGWSNEVYQGGRAATIEVPSPGVHRFSVWMREDGATLDKVVLTANSSYVPSQLGPAQSPRQPVPEEEPAAVETGEVTLNWVAPAVREDGTALDSSEIDSYELRFGQTPDLENMQQIADTEQSFYVLRELPLGITHYAALRVRDTGGQISELSNIIEFQAD